MNPGKDYLMSASPIKDPSLQQLNQENIKTVVGAVSLEKSPIRKQPVVTHMPSKTNQYDKSAEKAPRILFNTKKVQRGNPSSMTTYAHVLNQDLDDSNYGSNQRIPSNKRHLPTNRSP